MDIRLPYIALVYLLSSIPYSLIVAKSWYNIDLRDCGDKNPGAYNVWRYCGKGSGLISFGLDFFKGAIPILIVKKIWPTQELMLLLTAISAVSGHAWSLFLAFRGGKSLAVTAGVYFALVDGFIACAWFLLHGLLRLTGIASPVSVLIVLGVANVHTFSAYKSWQIRLAILTTSLIVIIKHKKAFLLCSKNRSFKA